MSYSGQERRSEKRVEFRMWAISTILAILVQAAIVALAYGKLDQHVTDIQQQVDHVQAVVDAIAINKGGK